MIIAGKLIDIFNKDIYGAEVTIENGMISSISPKDQVPEKYILPGLIDAHIHIESSMLVPSEFAREAVKHGTVATVSDPHEIANVLGVEGVEFMINNGDKVPFKFYFGAPSCVPATGFETAGAVLDSKSIELLLRNPKIHYLSEMMNYPGVIYEDPEVMEKLTIAKSFGKPIDGHAPGLRGEDARKYINAGISTDHECFTLDEAIEKIEMGMKVIIREGSAAKNFDALYPLIDRYPEMIMMCSDDKHPDDLLEGHMNALLAKAVSRGCDLFNTLRAVTINPKEHYDLDTGLLRKGDPADMVIVSDIESFNVESTYIDGRQVYHDGKVEIPTADITIRNNFTTSLKKQNDFVVHANNQSVSVKVIKALDGELITELAIEELQTRNGALESDTKRDILKICVVNRYMNKPPAVGFIHGFGIKNGAIASSVAHDSHNIVVVGVDDVSITQVTNEIIRSEGGIALSNGSKATVIPLPIAGLMSDKSAEEIGREYSNIDTLAKELGSKLRSPFMTLSFMALLVIPRLKLSDKGLFDSEVFNLVDLESD